ncbi:MAG: DUF3570 domain-containing protein [Burkholderiales bacterium]|nr:DUF3570 domain-containing protein [Burkholderiales bacterium]
MQLTVIRERSRETNSPGAALLALTAAAMAIAPTVAHAEVAPDAATVEFKYLDYLDNNHDRPRMHVTSPTLYVEAPVTANNVIAGSATIDTMSGASAELLNALSGASGIGVHDKRRAEDLTLTHYFGREVVAVGGGMSDENDYHSRAFNANASWSTDSQNTTLSIGASRSNDRISADGQPFLHQTRHTNEFLLGVTQVLTPQSIVQSNLTFSDAHGYLSDPYKILDTRPGSRHEMAWLTRYRYYVASWDAALHVDYRYFRDNWKVQAHTLDVSLYQPLGHGWQIVPELRYYSQGAAYFFSNTFPPPVFGALYSPDERLGAFGAITEGIKASKVLAKNTTLDFSANRYEQRASWRLGGHGSYSLEPFIARWFSIGLTHTFR